MMKSKTPRIQNVSLDTISRHGTSADERNRKELLKTVPDESALRKLN